MAPFCAAIKSRRQRINQRPAADQEPYLDNDQVVAYRRQVWEGSATGDKVSSGGQHGA